MHNIQTYSDNKTAMLTLFQTPLFRGLIEGQYNEKHPVLSMFIDIILKGPPIITFDYDDFKLEGSHFTSWMGFTQLRHYYKKPMINDLYYLHELAHTATMPYLDERVKNPHGGLYDITNFHYKMSMNELLIATLTEVYVYKEDPTLRDQTFDFPIWCDRIRPQTYNQTMATEITSHWWYLMDLCENTDFPPRYWDEFVHIACLRKAAIMNPDPFNMTEMQISFYGKQNYEWTLTWQNNWLDVERHMRDYHLALKTDPKGAVEDHIKWIQGRMTGNIPFAREAEVFSTYTEREKMRGGNQILQRRSDV